MKWIALAVLWTVSWSANGASVLRVEGQRFVDPQGRTVLLRGVNVSGASKLSPFVPFAGADGKADLSRLDPLPGWGVNVIRLLFTWEAYEPVRGEYNEAYLDELVRVADAAWERGIHVIVDFHQDAFSRHTAAGCGDGFPRWAVPEPLRRKPEAARDCGAQWSIPTVVSPSLHFSFHDFYANRDGVRDAFLETWRRISKRFADRPGVIGYEPLNEPWGDEVTELGPLYRDTAAVVRENHPGSILFIDPSVATVVGFKMRLERPRFENFAIAPHFYENLTNLGFGWDPRRSSRVIGVRKGIVAWARRARDWNVPLFLGEFGAPAEAENVEDLMSLKYSLLDDMLASGAQWNYAPEWTPARKDGWNSEDLSIVDDRGALRRNFKVRPTARRISGVPVRMQASDGRFELAWDHDPATGETEAFIPGEPKEVLAPADVSCRYVASARALLCSSAAPGPKRVAVSY